ncbi:MAG: MerR family DNA-binding transcriptional regulator [Fimbriimonas ginsengisoli]|uniref:MerR family DNA-binding transcriptional regulator n=1 Tax=Fimbriimonas ginsengisoli TaxID=1005039 RepID=A0A931LT39_FIMGI|nr:MerR family DNA-binding transcriptional regulator [Fimbriimonas ginsengisoli]
MLTVADAAELLGVSSSTLRNWDRAGKLKARRHPMNGYRLYEKAEILVLREAIANYGPSGTDEPSGGKHEDDNSRK